jgi:hypothetical protein
MSFVNYGEKIQGIFPEWDRETYVARIKMIQSQLCPTCIQNQDAFPDSSMPDCPFRPRFLTAESIYEGGFLDVYGNEETKVSGAMAKLADQAFEHWQGALLDFRGALKQIARITGFMPYHCEMNCLVFGHACAEAQSHMTCLSSFTETNSVSKAPLYRIGVAYKYAKGRVFTEMARLGREED